jgi:hypothetical protein
MAQAEPMVTSADFQRIALTSAPAGNEREAERPYSAAGLPQ